MASLGVIEATTSVHLGLPKTIAIHGDQGTAVIEQEDVLRWELTPETLLAALDKPLELGPKSALRAFLLSCAAHYLAREQQQGKPLDPVTRFHLGNGARIERLNWAGDPSAKALKQSYGLMVNYLYDLKRLDKHRAMFAQGQIPISGAIEDLYL